MGGLKKNVCGNRKQTLNRFNIYLNLQSMKVHTRLNGPRLKPEDFHKSANVSQ